MLKQRIITAAIGIPFLIAAIWFNTPLPWFTILMALWGAGATIEFFTLVKATRATPLSYLGVIWTLLFILSRDSNLIANFMPSFTAHGIDVSLPAPLLFTSAAVLSLIWLLARSQKEQAFNSWAWTMGGIIYTGWLLSYLVALRGLADGRNWVFLTLFVTFASDAAAFFVGRTWGRRRLAPSISPAKTWEGAIGGVSGAIFVTWLFTLPTPLKVDLSWWQSIALGFFVSIFGQLGDLIESLFKRNVGAKDSGRLLPGHGGVLDRMDSVVFAGIVVYYYVIWIVR